MNPIAILLILVSTIFHASWNILAKHTKSEHIFFERMLLFTAAAGFIPMLFSKCQFPSEVFLYVCISGTFCGFYFFSLANAYQKGDFTTVYPVARALPVILLGFIDATMGKTPTAYGWIGMLFITTGCFLSPLQSIKEVRLRKYLNKASLCMLLTALGTVGYTFFDKLSSQLIQQGPVTAAQYGYLFFASSAVAYVLIRRIFRNTGKLTYARTFNGTNLYIPVIAGALNFIAYWLVLWAYQITLRASYVVAFRQFSIVIGSIIAFGIFREKGVVIRTIAISIMVTGLVMIALWG